MSTLYYFMLDVLASIEYDLIVNAFDIVNISKHKRETWARKSTLACNNPREYQVMKTLARSDLSVLTIEVKDSDTVQCALTVRKNKDQPRVQINKWVFNFKNVTATERLVLAVKTCKIIAQREMTKSKDYNSAKVWEDRTFSVRAMIDAMGKRETVDAVTAADRAFNKLSDAEKDAQLEVMIAWKKLADIEAARENREADKE